MFSYVRSETLCLDVQALQEMLLSQNRPRIPSKEGQEDPGNDRGVRIMCHGGAGAPRVLPTQHGEDLQGVAGEGHGME